MWFFSEDVLEKAICQWHWGGLGSAHSLFMYLGTQKTYPVTVHWVMFLLGKAIFEPIDIHNFTGCVMSFRVTCWMFIILQVSNFIHFIFLFESCVINFTDGLSCNIFQFPCNSFFWCSYCYQCYAQSVCLLFSEFWFTFTISGNQVRFYMYFLYSLLRTWGGCTDAA